VRLAPKVFAGQSVQKLDLARDFAWLDPASQQARDIERFRHFSNDFIARDPAEPNVIVDIRYSIIPNEIAALWSLEVRQTAAATAHANFRTHRQNARKRIGELWDMMADWRF
jgi:inner membrane protein